MKLRLSLVAAFALCVVSSACTHHKRADWRSPSPPMVCTSDADCRGGTCGIEPGATQGTCSGQSPLPLLPQPDGGAPSSPVPNVQPSPNDIQI